MWFLQTTNCVSILAPEPNIESQLPNVVIREELGVEVQEKYYKYQEENYDYMSL